MNLRAKDYLVKNGHAIEADFISDIRRVLGDLYKIRNNEDFTKNYYDSYLNADYRFDCLDERKDFVYNPGEIYRNRSSSFRGCLLEIIKDDPSFGYLYHLLGMEVNAKLRVVRYNCVPNTQKIEFYIKYTWEDIKENIAELPENEKLRKLMIIKADCSNSDYPQNLKDEFIRKCDTDIDLIKALSEIAIAPSNVTVELENPHGKIELFENKFIDEIDSMCRGKLYRNKDGNRVSSYYIFNNPKKYGNSLEIMFRNQKRTYYLIRKMFKLLQKTHNNEAAKHWIELMAGAIGTSPKTISRISIVSVQDRIFKDNLDPFFQQYGIE